MTNQILLTSIPIDELSELFRTIVREELGKEKDSKSNRLFTQDELCELLHVSKPTIAAWSRDGKLQPHRMGRRVYYKEAEIDFQIIRKFKK